MAILWIHIRFVCVVASVVPLIASEFHILRLHCNSVATDSTSLRPLDPFLERGAARQSPEQLEVRDPGRTTSSSRYCEITWKQPRMKWNPDVNNSLPWGFAVQVKIMPQCFFFLFSTMGECIRYWKSLSFLRIWCIWRLGLRLGFWPSFLLCDPNFKNKYFKLP